LLTGATDTLKTLLLPTRFSFLRQPSLRRIATVYVRDWLLLDYKTLKG
jgi:hypothetical protein